MKQTKHLVIFLLIMSFGCKPEQVRDSEKRIMKLQDSDRFRRTMIDSKYYILDTRNDQTVETEKGSFLIIPSGSLLYENGRIVEDSVQIELAEGIEIDEIIYDNPKEVLEAFEE